MIICFECSKETKRMLDVLLESHSYDDYGQVIENALQTLHLLKREMGSSKTIIIGETRKSSQSAMESVLEEAEGHSLFHRSAVETTGRAVEADVPNLFQRSGLERPSTFAEISGETVAPGAQVSLDRWLFAMYNKLLPAKANCRALAHLQAELGSAVNLSVAHERVGEQVARLGNYLKRIDSKHKLKRDQALSVAFPLSRDKGDKSVNRYVNQFVGGVNKTGEVSGMLWSLKLIGYSAHKDPMIMLTHAGWKLAELANPLLDGLHSEPSDKFSTEEVTHLLDHIRKHVQVEDYTYRTILAEVNRGHDSPDELDAALRSLVLSGDADKYTDSFLSSQRSGAVSRMADLGLVTRVRKGVRVEYRVTERGLAYFNNGRGSGDKTKGEIQ